MSARPATGRWLYRPAARPCCPLRNACVTGRWLHRPRLTRCAPCAAEELLTVTEELRGGADAGAPHSAEAQQALLDRLCALEAAAAG